MMTIKDIGELLDLLESNYGSSMYKETNRKNVLHLWTVMFAEDDLKEVAVAVMDCIATLNFPPRVSDIKSRIAQNKLAGQLTEMEVWQIIRKAVEDSNSYAKAKEIYESLPKIVRDVAGSPSQLRSWRTVSDEQFETVIMSMVTRTYRTVAQREVGYHALPKDIQEAEPWRIDGAPKPDALPAPKPLKREKTDWEIRREEMGLSDD